MDREIIIPDEMQEIVSRAGYAPAVKVGDTIYVVGQVGRTKDLKIVHDPLEQFRAMFRTVKNEVFPKGTYAWSRIGVSELAHQGLLAEVKCVAVKR